MTDALVQFLRARLDDDEQVARRVEDQSAPWGGQWVADEAGALRTRNGHVLAYGHVSTDGRELPIPLKPGLVEHWARHDPARALADVDAKRQALDHYERCVRHIRGDDAYVLAEGAVGRQVQYMALPYADHPDYRKEWKP
ncbi:DUF6221 family protein [Streptomyces sp. NPDC058621]|uniref:DUF6221 family protein n=1 Tax=Streptomyces sp. NPDC058621 TaxID=3346561 RepID=UPI0036530EC4